jgi:uncharacterized protein YyaL (SSP411 family)
VLVFRPEGEGAAIAKLVPYTKEQTGKDGKATAYICRNFACQLPTTEIQKMRELLEKK